MRQQVVYTTEGLVGKAAPLNPLLRLNAELDMDWIKWDDCDRVLVIIAAQLMLFLTNYDL